MATTTVADHVAASDTRPTHRVPDPFPLTMAGMMAMLGPQAINFGISVGGGEASCCRTSARAARSTCTG